MAQNIIEILIEGEGAAEAADLFKAALDDQGVSSTVTPVTPDAPPGRTRDAALAVGVAGVILAIPGALLATRQLLEKAPKRQQLERLKEQAYKLRVTRNVQTTIITLEDGTSLDQADVDRLLELLEQRLPAEEG